jgi:hypothetical protein
MIWAAELGEPGGTERVTEIAKRTVPWGSHVSVTMENGRPATVASSGALVNQVVSRSTNRSRVRVSLPVEGRVVGAFNCYALAPMPSLT